MSASDDNLPSEQYEEPVDPPAAPLEEATSDQEASAEVAAVSIPEELEEPAPEVQEVVPDAADAALVEAVGGGLTWLPFALYLGSWVVLCALSAYLLYDASPEQPARWMPEYVPLMWAGIGLTAFGPVLSLLVWLVARARRPKTSRRGLFASAMTRGAFVAFSGVVLWIGTLFALDLVASGWAL